MVRPTRIRNIAVHGFESTVGLLGSFILGNPLQCFPEFVDRFTRARELPDSGPQQL